ncbi:MAG: ABC transporter ATP-binding protein/permease, partial [Acetatifactor sp.]|nr:ABC transporter ATP-binding protein/permease [Acetatifactor sp.]
VDGVRITDYTLSSLRQQIAVVQQENGLFHGSLRENISLSEDRGQDGRIWEILEGLKLKELVEQWPEGLDTVIGSGSREMSGGQKQRVAIARCIYRKPRILLLDEATSALDESTERVVNAFIYDRLPDTTILSVAHRFSTVLAADKAVVMEQGSVAAVGEHDRLLQENELYRTLYEEYRQAASGSRNSCPEETPLQHKSGL